jgi:chromosome segregation ATPase
MLTLDDIEGFEIEASDTYVDGSSLGGSTTYNPTITKLCADWRELQSQLQASKTDYEDMREAWKEDEKRISMLCDNQRELQATNDSLRSDLSEVTAELNRTIRMHNEEVMGE